MSANANDSSPAPSSTSSTTTDVPDAREDGETADDKAETGETNDGPDVGPDANPNEPGHQDADDK